MRHELTSLRLWLEATEEYVQKKVDPALMTWQEFWELVNEKGKYHSSDAYNHPLSSFNKTRNDYPNLLYRKKINGIIFEFRYKKTDRFKEYQFVKTTPDGQRVEIDGQVQYFTPEELAQLGRKQFEYDFSAFDGEQQVAVTQDEWGCLLIMVAPEYRKFGLGTMLTKLAWEAEPGKTTGGTTHGGAVTTRRVHTEFVREYLRKGIYSQLVHQRILSIDRVKEITASASLSPRANKPQINLNSNDPNNFLVYGENGCFVIYDRKLKDLVDQHDENMEYWYEKMIKGICYAGGGYHATDRFYLQQWGGDTPQLKKFMLTLALSYCKFDEDMPLFIYSKDLPIDESMVQVIEGKDPNGKLVKLAGSPMNFQPFLAMERKFRKSFDPYDEFKWRMVELAEAKFQH
jgi:GNAT superfamily N-acetyltransferase